MFSFGKKARERKALEAAQRALLRNVLRTRVCGLVDTVAAELTEIHGLAPEKICALEEKVDQLKAGIDLMVFERFDWIGDERIPEEFRDGAMIGNYAHAYFFLGVTLNDPKIYDLIGTRENLELVSRIYYSLGFASDGMTVRE